MEELKLHAKRYNIAQLLIYHHPGQLTPAAVFLVRSFGLEMSRTMIAGHIPPLRVDTAGGSDHPRVRRPSVSKSLAMTVPSTRGTRQSLYLSQDQGMDTAYPHVSVCRCVTHQHIKL